MPDDAELFVSYGRRGELAAFEELVRRHARWMAALLSGLVPECDVEDALQETWLRVIKAARRFRGGSVRAYLAQAARRTAIDRLRRRRGREGLEMALPEGEEECEPIDGAPAPDDRFESSATSEEVRAAVQALPSGPRQVLLLRIEAELSFREIAVELGVPLGTALTWMRTATERLRRQLGRER